MPADIAAHLIAVANEALSNVVRHAHATTVGMTLDVDRADICLVVRDDGVGIASGGRRSGLANMHQRAVDLGGTMHIDAAPAAGTTITWQVPNRA